MRRVAVILALITLLLPIAAWADGLTLTNRNGTINVTVAGIVSTHSHLHCYGGVCANPPNALGYVDFTTGPFSGTDIFTNGTFSPVGSSFEIVGVGSQVPHQGVIFSGAFVGPISWTIVSHTGLFGFVFELSGTIQGQFFDGRTVTGTTQQFIDNPKNQWQIDHTGRITVGTTHLTVPEPGTLGLLGTGLVALAGTLRRKLLG